ncbi:MAG: hypothetical protein ACTSXY_09555, partial [Promethearchaeota archaeon]
MKSVLASSSIKIFRRKMIRGIFEYLIKEGQFNLEIFHNIRDHTYGLYRFAPEILYSLIQQHIKGLTPILIDKRIPSIKKLNSNLFGALILEKLSIYSDRPLTSENFSKFKTSTEE